MAYAALVSLAQILQNHQNLIILFEDEQQIQTFHQKLNLLQEFLEDYSQNHQQDILLYLERQIRDAAFQAQDTIECYITNQFHFETVCCGFKKVFQRLISTLKKAILSPRNYQENRYIELRHPSAKREHQYLQKQIEDVDFIVQEVIKIKNTTPRIENSPSRTTSPSIHRNTLVGFDEKLNEIKSELCGEQSKLQIISVIGMGGIGKTSLARNLFDDSFVVYHFDIRSWITVTQECNIREILICLLGSITRNTENLMQEREEVLSEYVYKELKGRRYLVVLDDIWSINVWDALRKVFPDDNNGSRILLTTRLLDIAVYADSFGSIHEIGFLKEDQSWELLQNIAFAQECCPPELEKVGKIIARKCRGLPLTIVVIAGLLTKIKMTYSHWENIASNLSSTVTSNYEHVSEVFSLSYNHLPHHLRACLLYMGGFSEDQKIPVSKLVNIWVAEGFLKPNETKTLEEVAEDCLDDLVKRCLVLVIKKRSNGRLRFCGMHDLLRDLCIRKASDENFLHVIDEHDRIQESVKHARRLFIYANNVSYSGIKNTGGSFGRTLLFFAGTNLTLWTFTMCFPLIRVLDAPNINFPWLTLKLIANYMIHLRYLSFIYSYRGKRKLPKSLSKLENLQVLIVYSALSFGKGLLYPLFEIWKMPQLRHLYLRKAIALPIHSGKELAFVPVLEHLQTLSGIINFSFAKDVIEMIPNLKKLKGTYACASIEQWSHFHLNNLVHLTQIESLNLKFCFPPHVQGFTRRFDFPLKLKKLTLENANLPWKDISIMGCLPNLEVLKLRQDAFVGEGWEPSEGEFPKLKFLVMEMLDLKYWRAECDHFPCLERLRIGCCAGLEEIPSGIGDIATVELIEVCPMSKCALDSAMVIQEEQRNNGNDLLQVREYRSPFHLIADKLYATGVLKLAKPVEDGLRAAGLM